MQVRSDWSPDIDYYWQYLLVPKIDYLNILKDRIDQFHVSKPDRTKKKDQTIHQPNFELPERVTLAWLWRHVSYRFWLSFAGLLIAAFVAGLCVGQIEQVQKVLILLNVINKEVSPSDISKNEIEKNVAAIQSQAKGFATLSSDQKNKVSKLIDNLAQNMSIRDSAFVNDRSVDFVNHVIAKGSEGIPWDEVNLLSELFVELDEPSLRILSAYTALQTNVITIWRSPKPRAYPGEVSIGGRDKMKVCHELKCGWIAIDEATRNFRTKLIAVCGWHHSEEGRGRVELLEKGKTLVEYINGSVPIHPQLIK